MFNPSKEEVRRFFCDTWQKYTANTALPLSPMEMLAVEWMRGHPEYHDVLNNVEEALAQDYSPDKGQTNPFLHLSMHLSIAEQVQADQPQGIRAAYEALTRKLDSNHAAHHEIMECLGEMLWQSQRSGQPPDGQAYIEAIQKRAS